MAVKDAWSAIADICRRRAAQQPWWRFMRRRKWLQVAAHAEEQVRA